MENIKQEFAALTGQKRLEILQKHRENGVMIPLDDGIIITEEVTIGKGSVILPGTILRGKTTVGEDCEVGPNAYLENAVIGDGCRVISSYIDSSELEAGIKIGPMSNVRPGCHIGEGAKIGDFVELKNSKIGKRTSIAHLSYVGDSDVGARCNFGCGVVTVNFDGAVKRRTTVGDDVFIGCNTNLIAPVTLGDGVYSAAGTTVTEDVPKGALVIGRSRQHVKVGWLKPQDK